MFTNIPSWVLKKCTFVHTFILHIQVDKRWIIITLFKNLQEVQRQIPTTYKFFLNCNLIIHKCRWKINIQRTYSINSILLICILSTANLFSFMKIRLYIRKKWNYLLVSNLQIIWYTRQHHPEVNKLNNIAINSYLA